MSESTKRLHFVYDGWSGYNDSLVAAVAPLNADQLAFRGASDMPSVGELIWHIGDGRVDWFHRMGVPGAAELWDAMEKRRGEPMEAQAMVEWLGRTWKMIDAILASWTVDDLTATFREDYQGKVYAVSRQWTVWRIMCHDIHHGGQLSELLALQGIQPLELTLLGGHLTEPPLAE